MVKSNNWKVVFVKQALKDAKKASSSGLKSRIETLLQILENDPYQNPPPFECLIGGLQGAISRRINIQHRLAYQVYEQEHTVKVLRMWTHYDK